MHFYSNYRTNVLSHSSSFLATLISEALLSAPLTTHAESMSLECVLFSLHPSTDIEFCVIRDELGHVPYRQALLAATFLWYIPEELAVNGRASSHHIHPEAG